MRIRLFGLLILVGLFACTNNTSEESDKKILSVAVASNLKLPLDSLIKHFQGDFEVDISTNATGLLATQIYLGAPYDVFIVAGKSHIDTLNEYDLLEKVTPLVNGPLVFAYTSDTTYSKIEDALGASEFNKIGIPNPDLAPYGLMAMAWVGTRWGGELPANWIHAESVNQVNHFLNTEAVNAAFTASSFKAKFKNDYQFIDLPEKYKVPIAICDLKCADESKKHEVDQFINFVQSKQGKDILSYFGYTTE